MSMPGRILILLSGITFVVLLGVGIVVPILPSYARGMGATATQVGVMFAVFSLARITFNPLVGYIADRSEIKRLMLVGLFLYAFIAVLYVYASSPAQLIAIRIFQGAASACILPLAISYVALIARRGEEGLFMGSFNMALFFGMGTGPLLGGFLMEYLGINAAFYCLSLFSFISGMTTLALLPPRRPERRPEIYGIREGLSRYRPMGSLLFFRIIIALGRGSLLAFVPLLGIDRGLSMSQIGLLISVNVFVAGIFQRETGRRVSDDNRLLLVVTGSLLSAASLACLPLAHHFSTFLMISSLMGLGSAIALPAASVMAMGHGASVGMASAMSVFEASRDVGMMLGPLLSGVVMDLFGIDMVFYVGGMVCLAGTILFMLVEQRRPW